MNHGIDVTYHDDELECAACGEYSAVTTTWDHQTDIVFWVCPFSDCGHENVKWGWDFHE